jgi:hypothetical protein
MRDWGKGCLAVIILFVSLAVGTGGGCAIGMQLPREWWAKYGTGIGGNEFNATVIGALAGLGVGGFLVAWMWRRS